jgi:hypothetical protein
MAEKRASPLGKRKLDALAMQMGDWEFYANGFRSRPLRRRQRADWVDGGTLPRRVLMDRRSISRVFFFFPGIGKMGMLEKRDPDSFGDGRGERAKTHDARPRQ